MYALSPQACGPWALGIHIRQITRADVTTITYIPVIVISRYEDDIVVITQDQGGAEVKCINQSRYA